MYKNKVEFIPAWPNFAAKSKNKKALIDEDHLIIVDRYLLQDRVFAQWVKQSRYVYAVEAGENLKEASHLIRHLQNIFKIKPDLSRSTLLLAVGGGTVGDFAGFIASIVKRGLRYQVIPTTWLAVLDSAHGGKNGLNFKGIKNQIGTVYQPELVYISTAVLKALPVQRLCEARGEIIKTAFLYNERIYKTLSAADVHDFKTVNKHLKSLIRVKYKIVEQDPLETKGIRYQLNLGHTMGHVFEANLKISHGLAVLLGLYFCFTWSFYKGKMKVNTYRLFKDFFFRDLEKLNLTQEFLKCYSMPSRQVMRFLAQDKKRTSNDLLNFVFPVRPGHTEVVKIKVSEILLEYERQAKEVKGSFLPDVSI